MHSKDGTSRKVSCCRRWFTDFIQLSATGTCLRPTFPSLQGVEVGRPVGPMRGKRRALPWGTLGDKVVGPGGQGRRTGRRTGGPIARQALRPGDGLTGQR